MSRLLLDDVRERKRRGERPEEVIIFPSHFNSLPGDKRTNTWHHQIKADNARQLLRGSHTHRPIYTEWAWTSDAVQGEYDLFLSVHVVASFPFSPFCPTTDKKMNKHLPGRKGERETACGS